VSPRPWHHHLRNRGDVARRVSDRFGIHASRSSDAAAIRSAHVATLEQVRLAAPTARVGDPVRIRMSGVEVTKTKRTRTG
jgi:hypothetical protein